MTSIRQQSYRESTLLWSVKTGLNPFSFYLESEILIFFWYVQARRRCVTGEVTAAGVTITIRRSCQDVELQ